MIIDGTAPTGAAYLALNLAGAAAAQISCSKGLTAADLFSVWGSLAASAGGEVNNYPLGVLSGSGNPAPVLSLAWTSLVFKRTAGTGTGTIYLEGAAWGRTAPVSNALPTTPNAFSAPLSFASSAPAYVVSLDDAATSGDRYQVWGTNDATSRSPASTAGATYLGQLRGGGLTSPVLVIGYEFVILQCLTYGAATELVGVATPNDGLTSLSAYGPAAAAQTVWYIDGANVTGKASDSNSGKTATTPLLTDAQRAARIGNLPVSVNMGVSLLSSLQATDGINEPGVTEQGWFLVDGSQGATTLHTGTLIGAEPQSGNSPCTVTDSGVNWSTGGPGATSLIGYRLRITSGARAGAICTLVHDNGGGSAVVSDPEILALTSSQTGLTSVSLAPGDPYVVEQLPAVPTIYTPYGSANGVNQGGASIRYSYGSVAFSPTSLAVASTGDSSGRQFVGCNMGSIATSAFFLACAWTQGGFVEFGPGFEIIVLGCAFLFEGAGAGLSIAAGCAVTFDQGTLVYGGTVYVTGWLGVGQYAGGSFIGISAGIVGSSQEGLYVRGGGFAVLNALLWGSGNVTYGLRVESGAYASYTTKPTITGAQDTLVGGTAHAYSAVPVVNITNLAAITVRD